MRKGKKLIAIALCLVMCGIPMQAAGYYKTKKVQYGGLNIYYNGLYQNTATQAVSIDGVTYLPVRSFGNMLGLNINWNQSTRTINVSGPTANSALSTQAELQAKNYEIAALKKELAALKNQGVVSTSPSTSGTSDSYISTSGTDITSSEISETRKALNRLYSDYFDDIELEFSLSLSSSKLRLTIEPDSSTDYREFNKLSNSRVRNFIEDVCEYIRDRHDNIVITGDIEYGNKTLYSFNYSKNDKLTYSSDNTYDDESDLWDIVDRTKSVKISGYSSNITVRDTDISIKDSREYINFKLYLDISEEVKSAWNNNTGTDNDSVLRSYLRDIAKDLSYETDYEIDGELIDYGTGKTIGYYHYDDNEIYLYKI